MRKIIVTPGELVAYAEEFETKGAVYAVDYRYIAAALGVAAYDEKTHTAVVKPVRPPAIPQTGSVVYCQVTGEGRRAYQLRCFAVEEGRGPSELKYIVSGVLPHFFSDGEVGIGDYIRGRVVSTRGPPIVVSIRGPTYGVVLSRCPRCGSVLRRRGSALYCPNCGVEVKRKMAIGHYST
ncbi:exosome complex RNA-binding protein Csl4 [Pyrobaculum ferrireducens]|uniref:Exosome complex component Csl4 n=1 Tax=Pyrobaculum ferrireducens TaxID=1104324 RepID=G7VF62_9CREN|nr:exosome complex RNA-binding protein Csl4 [Pyrobaculum ferrireducens]AET31678.1 RNA binding S1 domain protein [Pyrobaculum ferrireducens]